MFKEMLLHVHFNQLIFRIFALIVIPEFTKIISGTGNILL